VQYQLTNTMSVEGADVGNKGTHVFAGARRTAYYPYLPPGAYTFRVIAANGDGVWSTEGKSLHIVVLPPFTGRGGFWRSLAAPRRWRRWSPASATVATPA
jgi:hypothetical protein